MPFTIETALKTAYKPASLSLKKLTSLFERSHINHERWNNRGVTRSVEELLARIKDRKALLVPYDDHSLVLVELILVLDIQFPISDTLVLHLFERHRHRPYARKKLFTERRDIHNSIALRMFVDELPTGACVRGLKEKLLFRPGIDVTISSDEPQTLDSVVIHSTRYPGLYEIQHRVKMICTLVKKKFKPYYKIRRKNGTIMSTFEWQPREVVLSTSFEPLP